LRNATRRLFFNETLFYKSFSSADKDKSGSLSKEEFAAMCKSQACLKALPATSYDQFFSLFDSDRSGFISKKEFSTALTLFIKAKPEEKLDFLFRSFDADGSGALSPTEIGEILRFMTSVAKAMGREGEKQEAFIKGVVTKLDKNKDGLVSQEEFRTVCMSTPSLLYLLGVQ
jgi:Ca2+-binding EF-hand superfamily protein